MCVWACVTGVVETLSNVCRALQSRDSEARGEACDKFCDALQTAVLDYVYIHDGDTLEQCMEPMGLDPTL